jgi:surface protein
VPRLGLGLSSFATEAAGGARGEDLTSFISTWATTGSDEKVTIPLVNSGTIDFTIDWGDGNSDAVTRYNDNLGGGAIDHTYSSADTYTITMAGTISGFKFNNSGDKTKIKTITQWGTFDISTTAAFNGCVNLVVSAIDAPTISATDVSSCFKSCAEIVNIGTGWDVSSIQNFASMFEGAAKFNGSDVVNWNMGAATNISKMFYYASVFNQDIGSWDVDDVTNMLRLFNQAPNFNQDISSWDISNVTNINHFLNANTAFSTANYNKLLHYWEADDPTDSLTFHGGDATTDSSTGGVDGTAARARLVLATGSGGDGWTITDGD